MDAITHYQAAIKSDDHYFPDRQRITEEAILALANHGTTPRIVSGRLQARADRIRAALLSGRVVETTTAVVSPLTTADYQRGRLTPVTGYERV